MATPDVQSALLAREGGADWLSLALIDARNHTLAWLGVFERTPAASQALQAVLPAETDFAAARTQLTAATEALLDALAHIDDDDDEALRPYRRALHDEDRLVETFATLAQANGIAAAGALLPPPLVLAPREPLWFGAQKVSAPPARGWRPDNEAGDHDEAVPEFEIDAQAVSWQQYVEFMADGGYDDTQWWSDAGWAWVQATQRRAPRDVEQWRHGVLVQSFGRPVRVSLAAPVMGVSRHEAEAWCRWAGRRLPAGIEWQVAASQGTSRGFVAHQVSEWVLGRATDGSGHAVQRGVPWFAPRRLAHPALRRAVAADRDDGFYGFRSCAV
jgi:iron(II)-dependent oxidoreductase